MKKIVTLTMVLALGLASYVYGQTDSVYVIKAVDDMSNKTYYYSSRAFTVTNEEVTIGFKIDVHIGNDLRIKMLTATMVGIGNCNENDEIIIMLENGEKIIKKSWKKFNCEGEAYFDLSESDLDLLRKCPLSKIRMTNGRTFDSFTNSVKKKDKRYFIQVLYALDNKLVKSEN